MFRFLFYVVLILCIFLAGFLAYMGFFQSLEVKEKKVGPWFMVFQRLEGEYQQTPQTIEDIQLALAQIQINPGEGFGIFYDDPKEVRPENLRSDVGVLIDESDLLKAKKMLPNFQSRVFSVTECMSTSFPYKNSLSMLLGIFRAYPALMEYAKFHGFKKTYSIEIYRVGEEINYYMPIEKYE